MAPTAEPTDMYASGCRRHAECWGTQLTQALTPYAPLHAPPPAGHAELALLMLQGNAITAVHPAWFRGAPAALTPILSPNPLVCSYAACTGGSDCKSVAERLACRSCSLGYVFGNATGTCDRPAFGPDARWDPTQQRSDFAGATNGAPAELYSDTVYDADPPPLAPLHARYVGYAAGQFDEISYRMDVGGAVDLECGTVVTGNTAAAGAYNDTQRFVNTKFNSDNSIFGPRHVYDSRDAFFTLRVVTGGTFVLDTCLSDYATSLLVLAEDGTVAFPPKDRSIRLGFSDRSLFTTRLPHERGCGGTSIAARAAVTLGPGRYTVVVDGGLAWDYGSSFHQAVATEGKFVLQVLCGDAAAQTANPAAVLAPRDGGAGMAVNPRTGAVTARPTRTGTFHANLSAVDGAGNTAILQEWRFSVRERQAFSIAAEPRPQAASRATNASSNASQASPDTHEFVDYDANKRCTDVPSPYMVENNLTCGTWSSLDSSCGSTAWSTDELYCQESCDSAGAGYAGRDCPGIYYPGTAYMIAPQRIDADGTTVSAGTVADIKYRLAQPNSTSFFVNSDTGVVFGEFRRPGGRAAPRRNTTPWT